MPGPWILLCLLLAGAARADEAGASFNDDFADLDRARWMISDGWSNGEWMNCLWSRDAVSVREGRLLLRLEEMRRSPGTYRCGEIQSRGRYGYGTYEALIRTGSGSGMNAAFFTYIGPVHERPHHEIDVEFLLRDTKRVSFNTYVDGTPVNGKNIPLPISSDRGFVHVAFVWTPDSIAWLVEGTEVHRTAPGTPIPTEPQKIYASLWSSATFSDWMGPFDGTSLPQEAAIEWVAFTRLGELCRFDQSVLCQER